jgi:N-acetylglucosaminyl-diphospho-decaprenol L-rhamnosyltransferase
MTDPEVSVLVVAYRSREDLPGCLACLPAAAGPLRLETVIVDNASRDGTPELVRERFPEATLIVNSSNRGFAVAVNQAARAARGRRLLLLNPDARPAPGCVAALVEALEERPSAGLAGPQLTDADGTAQASAWRGPSLLTLGFEALFLYNLFPRSRLHGLVARGPEPVVVEAVSGACLLVARDLFLSLGGLDERFFLYFEDTDLCLRARSAGREALLVPKARAVHAIGGSAFQDRRDFLLRFHESRRLFLGKHHPGLPGALMGAVHVAGLAARVPIYALASVLGGGAALRERASHHAAVLRRLWRSPRSSGP